MKKLLFALAFTAAMTFSQAASADEFVYEYTTIPLDQSNTRTRVTEDKNMHRINGWDFVDFYFDPLQKSITMVYRRKLPEPRHGVRVYRHRNSS